MLRNNQARKILQRAAFSTGLLLMTVPAAMAQADRAQAQHACAVIMGLNQSEASYDACIRSLDPDPQPQGNEAVACAYASFSTDACARDLRATLWNQDNIAAR